MHEFNQTFTVTSGLGDQSFLGGFSIMILASNNYENKIIDIKLLLCHIPFCHDFSCFVLGYKSKAPLSFTACSVPLL